MPDNSERTATGAKIAPEGHRAIPFNRSSLPGRELEYIFKLVSGGQIAGGQVFMNKYHALLEQVLQVPKALPATSCTHVLETAVMNIRSQLGARFAAAECVWPWCPSQFAAGEHRS